MSTGDAAARAKEWVELWNARNVEGVLSHYHEQVEFRSPLAVKLAGTPILQGKPALRSYWTRAIAGIEILHFQLDHSLWDPGRQELAIVYEATLDERRMRACELMRLNEDGLVIQGEALYGSI